MKTITQIKDLPEINFPKIEKLWEREYSPFSLSSWETAISMYLNQVESKEETKLSIFLTIYKHGVTFLYRDLQEQDHSNKNISEKLISNPEYKKQFLSTHKAIAQELEKAFKEILENNSFSKEFVKKYNEDFGKLCALNMPIQRCVDYLKDLPEHKDLCEELYNSRKKCEYIMGGDYEKYLELMNKKIAKIKSINFKLLKLLTIQEYLDFLDTNILPDNVEERENLSIFIISPAQSLVIQGEAKHDIFNRIQEKEKNESLNLKDNIIKGVTAHPGIVKGKVQVIKQFQNLDKFKENNILVVPSTLPKYEPYYHKAKAIIADEGGMLSHASIFCREFKIPGIIGTKHASMVLMDGDLVEVNADEGIIKIITKNSSS